jgi:hypothetical protein
MARRTAIIAIVLLIGLTLSACGGKPTQAVQEIETQTAAKIFATQTAGVPTLTNTPQPTTTPEATATWIPGTPEADAARIPYLFGTVGTPIAPTTDKEYYFAIVPIVITLMESLNSLGPLLSYPRFGDQGWRTQVGSSVVTIQLLHAQIFTAQPPSSSNQFHKTLTDTTGVCNLAMSYLVQGIDYLSQRDLDRSTILMSSCSERLNAIYKLLPAPDSLK